ncbi:hypothetical protein [Candidatus Pelagisphaera phototrophica]|uniref:hypothetical protein n=1 Tax=Candidatus Pelagisphaera phototrophica TaxID=2684113 RepID=UPI0024B79D38|nr:hypothetical protein [Candidatus Pelagisphaera phototrophica]QXD33738.1 hypothetical protein GA004_08650 [Candidatus Pelagisphaera phototrophica]
MDGYRSISISPDGLNLHVGGWDDNAVALFSRDTAIGAASFLGRLKPGEDDFFFGCAALSDGEPGWRKCISGPTQSICGSDITLYSGSENLRENDDWEKIVQVKSYKYLRTLARFHWPEVAQNAAMLVTMGQGLYTVILDGGVGDTGIELFEIYVTD